MSQESNGSQSKRRFTPDREAVFKAGHSRGHKEGIGQSLASFKCIELQSMRILMIVRGLPEELIQPTEVNQLGDAVSIIIETINHFQTVVDRKNLNSDSKHEQPLENPKVTP